MYPEAQFDDHKTPLTLIRDLLRIRPGPLTGPGEAAIWLHSPLPDSPLCPIVRLRGAVAAVRWATQDQTAELFRMPRGNVTLRLRSAYNEGELEESTRKEFLQVQREGTP